MENSSERREHVVQIRRSACVVKGGRRFSFGALVVIGNGRGNAGWGYGKAGEVPQAVEKAVRDAERRMRRYEVVEENGTVSVPYQVTGRFGASKVLLLPARGGTGLIAGGAVRAVLDCVGVTDILSKSQGSTNAMNVVRAVFEGLEGLEKIETVLERRRS